MQGAACALWLWQVEVVGLTMICKRGFCVLALRHGQEEQTFALMLCADGLAVVAYCHLSADVDMLTLLVDHLKGDGATGACQQMTTLGIEAHLQFRFQFLLNPGLGSVDDVFLTVVTCGVRTLIDGKHATIHRSKLPEEVACHVLVIKILAVLAPVRMFRHTEIEHPPRVGTYLVVARIE